MAKRRPRNRKKRLTEGKQEGRSNVGVFGTFSPHGLAAAGGGTFESTWGDPAPSPFPPDPNRDVLLSAIGGNLQAQEALRGIKHAREAEGQAHGTTASLPTAGSPRDPSCQEGKRKPMPFPPYWGTIHVAGYLHLRKSEPNSVECRAHKLAAIFHLYCWALDWSIEHRESIQAMTFRLSQEGLRLLDIRTLRDLWDSGLARYAHRIGMQQATVPHVNGSVRAVWNDETESPDVRTQSWAGGGDMPILTERDLVSDVTFSGPPWMEINGAMDRAYRALEPELTAAGIDWHGSPRFRMHYEWSELATEIEVRQSDPEVVRLDLLQHFRRILADLDRVRRAEPRVSHSPSANNTRTMMCPTCGKPAWIDEFNSLRCSDCDNRRGTFRELWVDLKTAGLLSQDQHDQALAELRDLVRRRFGDFNAEKLDELSDWIRQKYGMTRNQVLVCQRSRIVELLQSASLSASSIENSLGEDEPRSGAELADDAWLSSADIAKRFPMLTEGVAGKRLERWRSKHGDGWREVTDRRPREAKYLHLWGAVKHLFETSDETSDERPAK